MRFQVVLILNCICVLVIKTCDPSLVRVSNVDDERDAKKVCLTYGLGDTASGEEAHLRGRWLGATSRA
jgi:hypothetical protein